MLTLKKRVDRIDNQLSAHILNMSKDKQYMQQDINAGRENTSLAQRAADKNQEAISETNENQVRTEQTITDLDLQIIQTEQAVTDMDLRLMGLEG